MSKNIPDREEIDASAGACAFGMLGTVTVRGNVPARLEVWMCSNGTDFILVTHDCPETARQRRGG
jgi:hypothetical protein